MRGGTLTRLRIGFLLLGAALLVPLVLLLRSVESRLEAQRRLRHQIVAERIFDEMERELSALLAREGERPSRAYDATETRVELWAPFVVGYFTRDPKRLHVIAQEQLDPRRAARVERAVAHVAPPLASDRGLAPETERDDSAWPGGESDRPNAALEKTPLRDANSKSAPEHDSSDKLAPSKAQSDEVLRQLNRGADERKELKRKSRSLAPRSSASEPSDPLLGL
jgi:hypothetical protein